MEAKTCDICGEHKLKNTQGWVTINLTKVDRKYERTGVVCWDCQDKSLKKILFKVKNKCR